MKKLLSIVLALMLAVAPLMSVHAAKETTPVIQIMKYNGEKYVLAETANTEDLILVKVAFNQTVSSLATLRVKVEFEKEYVSYVGGSFMPELVAGNMVAGNPVLNSEESSLIIFFGRTDFMSGGTDEFLGGSAALDIASFVFRCNGKAGETKFKVTLDNAMSADYHEVVMSEKSASRKFTIKKWELTDKDEKVFRKLESLSYNPANNESLPEDSMKYIEEAENIYNSYSPTDKLNFSKQYPELFEYYRTARTRYFDMGLQADRAQIEAAAQTFRDTYQVILAMSAENVNLSNYESVQEAVEAWETLDKSSPQVTLLLMKERAKLDELGVVADRLENMVIADAEAKEWFVDRYQNSLWNSELSQIDEITYGDYEANIAAAKADYKALDYEALSDGMRQQVETLYKKLLEMEEKTKEEARKAGEDASVMEEITAFTEKWYPVTRLTMMTAGIKDISAMELFLEEYGKLSKTAQTRLASRKSMVEQLLNYVKGLNGIQGSTNTGNSNIQVVPTGGSTAGLAEQVVVEKEVEKLITQLQNNAITRGVPTIVYVSIILLVCAVLSLPLPYVVYRQYKKKKEVE